MIATRSVLSICSSTNFFSALRVAIALSHESDRSSTTSAIVRRTFSRLKTLVGSGTSFFSDTFDFSAGAFEGAVVELNEKFVIFCFFPFSNISISSGLRSVIALPFESVTVTSIWIRSVEILTISVSTGGGGDAEGDGICAATPTLERAITKSTLNRIFIRFTILHCLLNHLELNELRRNLLFRLRKRVGDDDLQDVIAGLKFVADRETPRRI